MTRVVVVWPIYLEAPIKAWAPQADMLVDEAGSGCDELCFCWSSSKVLGYFSISFAVKNLSESCKAQGLLVGGCCCQAGVGHTFVVFFIP